MKNDKILYLFNNGNMALENGGQGEGVPIPWVSIVLDYLRNKGIDINELRVMMPNNMNACEIWHKSPNELAKMVDRVE